MKLWIKILFVGIIVLVILFSAAYVFLSFKGKPIIIKQLEGLTQKKVSMGYFGLTPPFNIQIKKLDIAGLIKADAIYISPSILGMLTGKLALNEVKIIKPEFAYEKTPSVVMQLSGGASPPAVTVKLPQKLPLRLIFKHINIKDGKMDFIDRTVGENGIKLTVKEINFNLDNIYVFPRSVITNFELKGKIPWQEGQKEGKIEAEGWLNLFKKDMQATLKITDIDGIYLYPYYSNWVDLEKARIERANLNFASNLNGLNNNLTAECRLELTDIVRKPRAPEEAEEKASKITDAVLDIFRALNQGNIVLDFTIRTKMDRPEFGFGSIKMAFEDKLVQGRKAGSLTVGDVLRLPSNFLQATVRSATDLTKAVIGGVTSVGKELKKTVEETFKKEKKE